MLWLSTLPFTQSYEHIMYIQHKKHSIVSWSHTQSPSSATYDVEAKQKPDTIASVGEGILCTRFDYTTILNRSTGSDSFLCVCADLGLSVWAITPTQTPTPIHTREYVSPCVIQPHTFRTYQLSRQFGICTARRRLQEIDNDVTSQYTSTC